MIYSANKNELAVNESVIFTEAELKRMEIKKNPPNDFKIFVASIMEELSKSCNRNIGSGPLDAFTSAFTLKVKDRREKVLSKDVQKDYALIIPYNKKDDVHAIMKNMESAILKHTKKGSKIATGADYFYRVGKEDSIYVLEMNVVDEQIHVYCICVDNTKENMDFINRDHSINESSSISSEDSFDHDNDYMKPGIALTGLKPEDLYGFTPELGLARSEDLVDDPTYGNFFRDPKVMKAYTELFDMSDRATRKGILAMNEADQASVLASLTSKLYDNIVSKVDDIDYGDIPNTKGDITQLPNYEKMRECIDLLRGIITEFKQDTTPVDTLGEALGNIMARKDLFNRAFKLDVELPIITYNTISLAIISGISYMIATCIEFIKTPNQNTFETTLDRVALSKTKNHMLYKNLAKFNKCCESGDFDKSMEHIISNKIKGVNEAAVAGTIGTIVGVGLVTAAIVGLALNIIPILRELVFLFYYTRMRVSDFFDIQADMLQMNAYNLQNNSSANDEEKEKTVSKQLKIVDLFRKISNKISFTVKKAEVNGTKEIESNSKKMKLGDMDNLPDNVSSALF